MKVLTTLLLTAVLAAITIGTSWAGNDSDSMMKKSMSMGSEMDMQKMMNDPEMRERMQKHIDAMQTMLDSKDMSKEEMMELMNQPGMKSMMKKHKKCSEMMEGGMKDMSASMEGEGSEGAEVDHEAHHSG